LNAEFETKTKKAAEVRRVDDGLVLVVLMVIKIKYAGIVFILL